MRFQVAACALIEATTVDEAAERFREKLTLLEPGIRVVVTDPSGSLWDRSNEETPDQTGAEIPPPGTRPSSLD